MNNLILDILPFIETVAKRTTRLTDSQNELVQYTVLECYKYEDKVKILYIAGDLNKWISAIIFHQWLRMKNKEPVEYNCKDLEDQPTIDLLAEIQRTLTSEEKAWIKAYLKDKTYRAISKRAKIDEHSVALRLKTIIEKCKTLRHTLH